MVNPYFLGNGYGKEISLRILMQSFKVGFLIKKFVKQDEYLQNIEPFSCYQNLLNKVHIKQTIIQI